MATVVPESVKLYVNLFFSGAYHWVDLTSNVMSDIEGSWGMLDTTPSDRMAMTGQMTFVLRNTTGFWTPGGSHAAPGWGKNIGVKLEITYDGNTGIRFYGTINDLEMDVSPYGPKSVKVTVVDWFNFASNSKLTYLPVEVSKRGDQAITDLLQGIPVKPLATRLSLGNTVFSEVFDTAIDNTRAYGELSKIAQSEGGFVYLAKDKLLGETLVFETDSDRNGLRALALIPLDAASSGKRLLEDSSFRLDEDGSKRVLCEAKTPTFDSTMSDLAVNYGTNTYNRVEVKAYPKLVDASPTTVLFKLDSPMLVNANSTLKFSGMFINRVGSGSSVSGINIAQPSSLAFNTAADGSGTNITSSLTVTAVYSAGGIEFTAKNVNTQAGYITAMQVLGQGVYSFQPVTAVEKSDPSTLAYGDSPVTMDQAYQTNLIVGSRLAKRYLNQYKNPRIVLREAAFNANTSYDTMMAFLTLDVGDLVNIVSANTAIDGRLINGYYYIAGVKFTISKGRLIRYSWMVDESYSLQSGLTAVAVDFADFRGYGESFPGEDIINYGYLPRVEDQIQAVRSFSVWIRCHEDTSGAKIILSTWSDNSGYMIWQDSTDVVVASLMTGTQGTWLTNGAVLVISAPDTDWNHIVVTHDRSTPTANPIIYVNGTSVAFTVIDTPTGTVKSEVGNNFCIGNLYSPLYPGSFPFIGRIKDARVYNRILSAADVTALYGGTNITDGMVFQGPTVYTREYSALVGKIIQPEQKLIDNIYGEIGTVTGFPVANAV